MLKKMLVSLLMVGLSFLTGYAAAQSYFLNNASSSSSGSAQSNQSSSGSSDFQTQLQQSQDKKNQALSNQLKQELAKVPQHRHLQQPRTQPHLKGVTQQVHQNLHKHRLPARPPLLHLR